MASPRFTLMLSSAVLALSACAGGTAEPAKPAASAGAAETPESADTAAAESPAPTFPSPFPVDAFADLSDEPLEDDLAATLQTILDEGAAGGGTTATLLTPEGTWSGATGTADGTLPLTPEHLFPIGSITKPIIAAQIMLLAEAGTIGLDDPASDHLPADLTLDTNGATIRDLLAMQSGVPDFYELVGNLTTTDHTRVWTPAEAVQYVQGVEFPAGEAWAYSNTNYVLLGMVIEHVTGRPVAEVLRAGALRDEGLSRVVVQPAETPIAPFAAPVDLVESRGGFLPSAAVASSAGTAGGFAADSPSLAHWWRLFCGGEVVSQESLTTMAAFPEEAGYGLGLQDLGVWSIGAGHTGALPGLYSIAACAPDEKAVVVVITKNHEVEFWQIAQDLLAAVS